MDISSEFKLALLVVLGITVLSLIGIGSLALLGSEATEAKDISVAERNFYSACSFGWQSGVGAIFGLLGGKATS